MRPQRGPRPVRDVSRGAPRRLGDPEWERFLEAAGLEQLSLAPRPRPTWATPDVAPGDTFTAAATLLLPRTRRRRRTAALLVAAAAPIYTLGLAGFVLVYLKSPPNGVVSLLLWAPLMAVQVTWVYFRARIAFTRGSLGIRSEGLRIEDRGVLKRPLVVARSQIRTVVIDDRNTRNVAGIPLRFPFGPSQWLHPSRPELGATGWLWSGAHGGLHSDARGRR
jgi:hypothetical protein